MDLAAVSHIGTNYLREPDWDELFKGVDRFDVFLAYGSTWRQSNLTNLENLARKKGVKIRVFLPDPDDQHTVNTLATRFNYTHEKLINHINEAKEEFSALPASKDGSLEIFFRKGDALFSCYRFGSVAVLTLYSHQKRRTGVPTVVCQQGGSLYDFLVQEFDSIHRQSRRVFPVSSDTLEKPSKEAI
ncbi:hypothetical protein A8926_1875 [Saccharopolyspora spinosa]|uniref:Uncharacterized protein n=2 Tax=Saccharopolyspora spinosa TaxID=60894 RepID=A0A2N3XUJ8_SACSN|nr:hypothetical protein A8926_1875 [Saccharopolyspora spinosa]